MCCELRRSYSRRAGDEGLRSRPGARSSTAFPELGQPRNRGTLAAYSSYALPSRSRNHGSSANGARRNHADQSAHTTSVRRDLHTIAYPRKQAILPTYCGWRECRYAPVDTRPSYWPWEARTPKVRWPQSANPPPSKNRIAPSAVDARSLKGELFESAIPSARSPGTVSGPITWPIRVMR